MGKVLCGVKQSYMFDLLLETRMPHERFLPHKPGGKLTYYTNNNFILIRKIIKIVIIKSMFKNEVFSLC